MAKAMAEFAVKSRKWLLSVIRQRKVLIKLNKSYKPSDETLRAIEKLDLQLGYYSYENDLYMARFLRQYGQFIEAVLSGHGSSCYERRQLEWSDIRKKAALIEAANMQTSKSRYHEKVF